MNQKDVQKLLELRAHVISFYNSLENPAGPTSMMKTSDVAHQCETIVKSMEDVLKKYVNFVQYIILIQ